MALATSAESASAMKWLTSLFGSAVERVLFSKELEAYRRALAHVNGDDNQLDHSMRLAPRNYARSLRKLRKARSGQPFANPTCKHAAILNCLLLEAAAEREFSAVRIVSQCLPNEIWGNCLDDDDALVSDAGLVRQRLTDIIKKPGGSVEVLLLDGKDVLSGDVQPVFLEILLELKMRRDVGDRIRIFLAKNPTRARALQHFTVIDGDMFRFEIARSRGRPDAKGWELAGQGSFNDEVTGEILRERFMGYVGSDHVEEHVLQNAGEDAMPASARVGNF